MTKQSIRVVDETASGAVNGVNKNYTVLFDIERIEQIKVNNAIYGQASFSGKTISLDDAPTTGIVEVTYIYQDNASYNDVSAWIVGEQMEGVSDGTNRVFTSYYPFSLIDEVRVNGVPTSAYTSIGNAILLDVAPLSGQSVLIDYFRADFGTIDGQRDSYYTKKEIRDLIYESIGQDDTSEQYPSSLVDTAIKYAVSKIDKWIKDKSRTFTFKTVSGTTTASAIVNSINTISLVGDERLPSSGKIISEEGHIINYKSLSSGVATIDSNSAILLSEEGVLNVYVGIKLARNIARIKSVMNRGTHCSEIGTISEFINSGNGYFVHSGYLFLKNKGEYVIEIELKNNVDSDDSIVFVDKEDSYVIIDIALPRLYRERESDKYAEAYETSKESIRDFKAGIRTKRIGDKNNVLKTVPLGAPVLYVRNKHRNNG